MKAIQLNHYSATQIRNNKLNRRKVRQTTLGLSIVVFLALESKEGSCRVRLPIYLGCKVASLGLVPDLVCRAVSPQFCKTCTEMIAV